MKVRYMFILGLLVIFITVLSVKYASYNRFKSSKMQEAYSSLDRIISEYFYKYWEIPTKDDLKIFVENRKNLRENKNIADCLNYPGLTITPDSSDSYVLIKLFGDSKSVYHENTILLSNMNFLDFLIKREILVGQQSVDDLCSYFKFRFFADGEPYENNGLIKRIHELLIKLFHDEKKVDMKTAERCMFKGTVIDSTNVRISLVCGKIDDDFPFNELQRSIKKVLEEGNMINVIDKFYFPLYY